MIDKKAFRQRLDKIEELVKTIEGAPDPKIRAAALDLMRSLMDLYASGLERALEIVFDSGPTGTALIDELARDEFVENLLLLHGLHPLDLKTRVMQALEQVRPYLASHKGNVELIDLDEGVAHLKLQGSCSSAMTLKFAIEEAIYERAPDIAAIQVEGVVAETKPPGLVQLGRAKKNATATVPAVG